MKGIKITTLCIAIASVFGVANAETCVKVAFNVTYTCNGGTLSGTLPSNTTANYGNRFSSTAITADMCTPPSGHVYGGQAIIIDDETVAYYSSTSATSFTYYYTTDIEIGPHWVPIAEPATMIANMYDGAREYTYTEGASGTWTAYFWYGAVSGVSKCTTIGPKNTGYGYVTGLIMDYDDIEGASADGYYCYCKMAEPYIAASPWVFFSNYGVGQVSRCAGDCAYKCSRYISGVDISPADYGRYLRVSVFAGAMAE